MIFSIFLIRLFVAISSISKPLKSISIPSSIQYDASPDNSTNAQLQVAAASGQFTVKIKVGQQNDLSVVIDTSSSISIFKASAINPASDAISLLGSATVNYGYASISGTSYSGPVSVNGVTASSCKFLTTEDSAIPSDGVLGLGFDSSFYDFISALGYNGTVTTKYFGIFLASSTSSQTSSELTLGGFNGKRFTGPLYWFTVPASSQGWSFDCGDVSVYTAKGPTTYKLSTNGISSARINTASLFIQLDTSTAASINQQIGAVFNGSVYFLDCKSNGPNVIFVLRGGNIPIHVLAANYIVKLGDGRCISSFIGGAENSKQATLGIPFLQAAYTVYDYSGSPFRIAFAQSVLNSSLGSWILVIRSQLIWVLLTLTVAILL